MFVEWVLGKDNSQKIMTGSYNETLSTTFSKSVRNAIQEEKADKNIIVYSDIFPGTKIKRGDGSMNLWSLEGGYNNYLATSPGGTATGFGASILIMDDLVKSAEEAYNESLLEKHWDWFCFTGDTKVLTSGGHKEIKDVRVGDELLTYNHSKQKVELGTVVKCDSKKSSIYRLEFNNGKIVETTGNHRFYTNKGYKSIEEILLIMWGEFEEGETVLFPRVQQQGEREETTNFKMLELPKGNRNREGQQAEEVLFYGLYSEIQGEKFKVKVCNVGENKNRVKRKIQKMSKVRKRRKLASASYRPQHKEQRSGEFNSAMSIMPYTLSQAERLPSCDIRRVYDIEVSGNHNFFANDMLVHNCNTMLSRLEEGGKIIIIMTRWASGDLAGRVIKHFSEQNINVNHILLKALQDDGTMLCDEVLSKKSYEMKVKAMGPDIAAANYQQQPIDLKGKLYTNIKTYDSIPRDSTGKPLFTRVSSYTDTADTGADYLCNIIYGEYEKEAYILDVYYTKDPMEKTEPETAKRLNEYMVNVATIESNNGGRGFSRSVERILRELFGNRTRIEWFHQGENKQARILSNSTWVMDHIYFPTNWRDKWPEFYGAINTYQKEGKNKHDDAPDCLTGVAEKMQNNKKFGTLKKSTLGL